MTARTVAGSSELEAMEWVPVPGTRGDTGDEILVGFVGQGVVVKTSLSSAGLPVTRDDLTRLADFVTGADQG